MSKTVALALGSGGARGYAHIGVIDALTARGYNIVMVSGCSMGAIVGGFYCSGRLEEFRDWITRLKYLDVLKLVDVSLLSSGVIKGDRLYNRISEMLNGQLIEDLAVPFTAVATDIIGKKEVWFQRGPLQHAVRASAAIPSLFTPVADNGRLLVDGAVLNPLPITPCVSAHADIIIAVDLNADVPLPEDFHPDAAVKESDKKAWFNGIVDKAGQWLENKTSARKDVDENLGKLEMLNEVFEVMSASLTRYKIAGYPPDLLIKLPSDACEMYEFYRADEIIRLGREVADMALDAYEAGHSSLYGERMG
ncbi:patatin-like phospholipase family protein [Thalassolituus sp. LLYu03]|uniref:patatin-like phospholipase family protein n=1 Tax=Thalassolituus sp. LLYu03 TaxID=3421656 RepID=UPI003D29931E